MKIVNYALFDDTAAADWDERWWQAIREAALRKRGAFDCWDDTEVEDLNDIE